MVQCYCFQGYLIPGQAPDPDQITLEFKMMAMKLYMCLCIVGVAMVQVIAAFIY